MSPPAFCSDCGAGDLQHLSEEDGYRCHRCGHVQYLNSKPAVCAVVLKSTQVLLVRDHSTQEAWDLPGGFLRLAEPPPEGLKRELLEELNADVSVTRLLEVQIDPYGTHGDYSLNLYYEVNLVSETLVPSDEIAEYGWFSLTNLPRLKYPGTAAVLSHMATSVDGN